MGQPRLRVAPFSAGRYTTPSNNTMKKVSLIAALIGLVTLNHFYGSMAYATVLGQEELYAIGKLCDSSRSECETTYFKTQLDEIDQLNKKDRKYFSSMLIREDHVGYSGNCPCPYNGDVRGYSCGGRSSYSRGGQISYCYHSDVSDGQVESKRASIISDVREEIDDGVRAGLGVYNQKWTLGLIGVFGSLVWAWFWKS